MDYYEGQTVEYKGRNYNIFEITTTVSMVEGLVRNKVAAADLYDDADANFAEKLVVPLSLLRVPAAVPA